MMRMLTSGLVGLAACLAITAQVHADETVTSSADQQFKAIYQDEWEWRRLQFPGVDEDQDEQARVDHLPHVDALTQKQRLAKWLDVLSQLDALPRDELSATEQINYAVYRPQIENMSADIRYGGYEMPFNADSSFWSELGFMTRRPLRTNEDAEDYIARLKDVPRYFDEQIVNMRAGLKRGFSVPRAVLPGRDVSIAAIADLSSAEQSDFYKPLKELPESMPPERREQLRNDGLAAIREQLIPAYVKLLDFFRTEYMVKARKSLAAESMPNGKAYYRQQIREYTTLDLGAEEIHKIGLDEVARIHAEMLKTMEDAGFEGDFAGFLAFLRSDPRFYPKTPEELLMRAAWIAKRVDAKLPRFFGLLPRARFGIEPVPADIAPFWTAGRGGATTYWLNTYDLPSRPLYNLPALTLHESAPGHSMQLSLADEQTAQPAFRRNGYISAYGEGWGLYAEKLGIEMGIYTTPYENFGRLTYEMWRACRLVIDTGIHHKGWTRDKALAYLREHTALSEHEVTTEVDRYISWPGQALSYKLGELRIVALRAEAERELGVDFDIRGFHDAVLAQGSVPLPVLDAQIRQYIAQRKAASAAKNDRAVPQ
ncbi:MAG TPA: DUF885 family protein [Dokdonella sp.]|uniref:DUF885 domain-containing protein n=1 Tax=Dokdonella sp. TaxID=2291710 RepID=UPI002BDDBDD9|nr:DUF885 family protein [Dokdonella sp.]HOX71759.1 DUF885 family protein [Dokdonella sp.]HPG93569.1 DUF885 family protein [Dokdonella sp.]HPN78103.1 DUF885 family protein [Dokdonella sp.]